MEDNTPDPSNNVFVVVQYDPWEDVKRVRGVFWSEKKADAFIVKNHDPPFNDKCDFDVEEYTIE
ncbi:hypothetical protein LCGC14_2819270 [marine sediment metagenome]|uniref:Uncharacterized protein n=1 Tax=marine sediment metagenome TaxID=412755 RepID=A0A0F8YHJ9_9ZZZZ